MARSRVKNNEGAIKTKAVKKSPKKIKDEEFEKEKFNEIDNVDEKIKDDNLPIVVNETVINETIIEVIDDPDPILCWKKVGGGSLRLPNKIIKPNEKFFAKRSELPKVFMDDIILLDDEPVIRKEVIKATPNYFLKELSDSMYNIVDAKGKVINEKPLSDKDAKNLLNNLL